MHERSHERMVLYGVLFLYLCALMIVRCVDEHCVMRWARSVLSSACTILLCLL